MYIVHVRTYVIIKVYIMLIFSLIPYRLNDVMYNLIDSVFCPLFHDSEEVSVFKDSITSDHFLISLRICLLFYGIFLLSTYVCGICVNDYYTLDIRAETNIKFGV